MAFAEKTPSPEETVQEASEEPEPVCIDEVALTALVLPPPVLSAETDLLLSPQGTMDRTLALLQDADPAHPAPDSAELIQLEGTALRGGAEPRRAKQQLRG